MEFEVKGYFSMYRLFFLKKKKNCKLCIKVLLLRYELVGGDEYVDKVYYILSKYIEKLYWNGNL